MRRRERIKSNVKFREPYADGCDFRPRGVVCRDDPHDCAHCGWFPAEEKRRKLELYNSNVKGGEEK